MMKTVHHSETIELAHDQLMQAILDYLGARVPADYDQMNLIALLNTRDHHGVATQHRLSGTNGMKVTFSYEREVS